MKTKTNGVRIVTTKVDLKQFLEFPYRHYANDEHWIAPLLIEQKKLINTEKNPFFNNAEMVLFLAEQNGEVCGRIAAIIDRRYNEYHHSRTGYFGFFECIDDNSLCNLMFKVVTDWLDDKEITELRGPTNPGMMDEIGVLVDGYQYDPCILMPYAKTYYDRLLASAGFEKEMDLLAFRVNRDTVAVERMNRAAEIVRKRYPSLKIRKMDLKRIKEEVEIVRDIYNKAWSDNWGFIPLTKEELQSAAADLKMILNPDYAHVAEMDGTPVAFSIALPDLNQALKHLEGRLLPTGFIKLLWYRRKINRIRTALMGVLPEYQGRGIDALLHRESIVNGIEKGLYSAELSWVLESNVNMIRVAERIGAHREKTYRMYSKSI